MLLELITFALEFVADTVAETTETKPVVDSRNEGGPLPPPPPPPRLNRLVVVEIDHMRDRRRYVGALRSWTAELGLWCRLLRGRRRILLAVASAPAEPLSVKTFEKRLRTCKLDVDSRGRPCKGRRSFMSLFILRCLIITVVRRSCSKRASRYYVRIEGRGG